MMEIMDFDDRIGHEGLIKFIKDFHDKEKERIEDEMERMEFRKNAKNCLFNDIVKACKSKSEYGLYDRHAIYNFLCDSFQLTELEKVYLIKILDIEE